MSSGMGNICVAMRMYRCCVIVDSKLGVAAAGVCEMEGVYAYLYACSTVMVLRGRLKR